MSRHPHPDNPSQYGRPILIEERSNRYVIHPLAGIIERVAIKYAVSANAVSIAGLGLGLLAAVAYGHQGDLRWVLCGFLLMAAWHVFDGADGRVARATGTSSPVGRVIDGICDHLVFGAVYISFVIYLLGQGSSPWVWLLGLAAAASHGLQAAGYEERRQIYQRRVKNLDRDVVAASLTNIQGPSSRLAGIYDWAQRLVGGRGPLNDAIAVLRRDGQPLIAQTLVYESAKIVRAWALLNANNRTLMIAVFAAIGMPALYFVYEIVVLNTVLIALLVFERREERRILASAPLIQVTP